MTNSPLAQFLKGAASLFLFIFLFTIVYTLIFKLFTEAQIPARMLVVGGLVMPLLSAIFYCTYRLVLLVEVRYGQGG